MKMDKIPASHVLLEHMLIIQASKIALNVNQVHTKIFLDQVTVSIVQRAHFSQILEVIVVLNVAREDIVTLLLLAVVDLHHALQEHITIILAKVMIHHALLVKQGNFKTKLDKNLVNCVLLEHLLRS